MRCINALLKKEIGIKEKCDIFLKSINILQTVEDNWSYRSFIQDLTPLAEKNISTFESINNFAADELTEYVKKFRIFWKEYTKYQLWLVGKYEDCKAVKEILNQDIVHVLGERLEVPVEDHGYDFVIVCSKLNEDDFSELQKSKIIRYDFMRWCAYQISPESAYLELKLRKNIDKGFEGVLTGLSYEQRGINYNKLEKNIVCLATPSQDLYLDYKNFLWVYEEIVNKRKGKIKYCIIGMDYYRLWYDLSLSPVNNVRMLCFYKRLKCLHHYHGMDHMVLNYFENKKICDELMVDNYMEIDYQNNFHPELYYEKDDRRQYQPSDEQYLRDAEEVNKVFNKPYPQTFAENSEILERYLKFLYLHNIKTLIYIPPFPRIFNRFTSEEMKQKTLSKLTDLKEKYEFNILNLSEEEVFTNEYFSDWSHLNSVGADLATKYINEYMQRIWGN